MVTRRIEMNGVWRRSGMNNPYVNDEVAWQHIQDLQREAENRRMVSGAGRRPIELVALAWLKRSLSGLARSARSLRIGRKELA
jgi:hypothetical protein